MKLKFVTENEAPFRMKWMDELAKYMEVSIYHLDQYEPNVNKKYINYKLKRASSKNTSKKVLNLTLFKIKEIFVDDYDILLLDGYGFLAQQILILYLYLTKRKFGLTIDGGFIPKKEEWFKKKFKSFLITRANFCLSTSKDTDTYLEHYGVKKENIYRHFFSNISEIDILKKPICDKEKRILKNKLNLKQKKTLIYVGKVIYGKGIDILLDAIEEIELDYQLLIIGSSNDSTLQRRIIQNDKAVYIDFIDKSTLAEYYMASDIFILPTRGDVWGLVVSEAMAKGLPIITTDMCLAGKAMVENGINGYVVRNSNIKELKEAILTCLSANLDTMAENNLNKIHYYAVEIAAREDLENFKKIMLK